VAKSIELLKTGQVNYVDDISELPAATVSNGYMYYIPGLGIYYSNGTTWTTIDPIVYDNTIWSWGCNGQGRLGDNTTVDKSSPVSVVGGFTDWSQVSAGYQHSLGLRTNGTAWAWGLNGQGRLGDNTTVDKSSPVSVVGGFCDWLMVDAGLGGASDGWSIGLRTNGTLWSWGGNNLGQLGDNTVVSKSSPVSVVGGFTDWCQVSAGGQFSVAVRQNGSAWAWGTGGYGALGDNTTVSKRSPVSVVGGFTDWCQIGTGRRQALAIRTNGTAWAWGRGADGRLGDNTETNRSSPVSVVGGFTDWCQVNGGYRHSLAVRTNGSAWSWGYNGRGELGDGTTVNKSSPVSVIGGFTNWCQISAGTYASIAVRTNGTAWAWGCNGQGRLGDNTTVNKSSPVSVIGGFTDWCQASINTWSLAIRSTPDNI
jgi:alpha-tubulin suppressor-like RCC1 family protein